MGVFSHTDWTVYCNHDGCRAQVSTDDLDMYDGTAAKVRKELKRRGWAVGVPDPAWERLHKLGATRRGRRLDFCPDHKPAATEARS